MKSWQSDKLDSNIEADLLISWLQEKKGEGGQHVKLNIRHERQKSKTDMQIHAHTHTYAREACQERLCQRIFLLQQRVKFLQLITPAARARQHEWVTECNACVWVCVSEWAAATSRWQPDALLDGNIKQNDDVATLQMALRVWAAKCLRLKLKWYWQQAVVAPLPL